MRQWPQHNRFDAFPTDNGLLETICFQLDRTQKVKNCFCVKRRALAAFFKESPFVAQLELLKGHRDRRHFPASAHDFSPAAFDLAPLSSGFAGKYLRRQKWPILLSPTALIKETRVTHSAAPTQALPDVPGKQKVPVRTKCCARQNSMAATSTAWRRLTTKRATKYAARFGTPPDPSYRRKCHSKFSCPRNPSRLGGPRQPAFFVFACPVCDGVEQSKPFFEDPAARPACVPSRPAASAEHRPARRFSEAVWILAT